MTTHIKKHIKPLRFNSLPAEMLRDLKAARLKQGWSQAELGQRIGLPQMHISGIETGKIVPRFNTLIDLVRMLGYDLLMVQRSLVPIVQTLVRDEGREVEERPLYADDGEKDEQETPHDEI